MEKIFRNPGFLTHLVVYAAVNALLIVLNVVNGPDEYWFYWPLMGWGIGVLGHAAGVYFDDRKMV